MLRYLQNLEPPVLPRLNEEVIELRGDALKRSVDERVSLARDMGGCDGVFVRHHTHALLCGWGSDNQSSISKLLHGFFYYCARRFEWETCVVTVTEGGMVPKSRVAFHQGQQTFICIQVEI